LRKSNQAARSRYGRVRHVGRRGIIVLRRAGEERAEKAADRIDRIGGLEKVALEGAYGQSLTRCALARVVTDPVRCTAS
jgi:hypothetical protein